MRSLLFGLSALSVWVFTTALASAQPPAKYAAALKELRAWIVHEMKDKEVRALSIAVLEDQKILWAEGFGLANPETKMAASADTLFPVENISAHVLLLTVMALVEQGKLNLDAPVTKYLSEFRPKNPFNKVVTLRHLLGHASGLVDDWPDAKPGTGKTPTLAQRVESLNRTNLMFVPGDKCRFSKTGLGVLGSILESIEKEPFAAVVQRTFLGPLGVKHSGFALTPELRKSLARGQRWTYLGQTSDASPFHARSPADDLCVTATDLARILGFLAGEGKASGKQLLPPDKLKKLWGEWLSSKIIHGDLVPPLFSLVSVGGKEGFSKSDFADGISAAMIQLREIKLGVVVFVAKDSSHGLTRRIANATVHHFLAAREGKPLPKLERVEPIEVETVGKLAGTYASQLPGPSRVVLLGRGTRLRLLPLNNGCWAEVKRSGTAFLVDGLVGDARPLVIEGNKLMMGGLIFERVAETKPPPEPPAKWRALLGLYQATDRPLTVLEMDGGLFMQDGLWLYPLKWNEFMKEDEFILPMLNDWEKTAKFIRDKQNRAIRLEWKGQSYLRRKIDGEDGQTFTIKPLRPIEELRKAALEAKPPFEKPGVRKPELVDLEKLDKTLKFDIRYATTNNFLSTKFYTSARAFLQKPAAEALLRAHRQLKDAGYGLLIFDPYRPWHVTKMFWDATPPHLRNFVADPSQGSRHNRGCAVDLTLYDLKTGQPVEMVSGFDEMTDRAYPDYLGGTSRQRWHRDFLRRTMEAEGFTVYEDEWWHYDYRDWRQYPILNTRFEELP